MRKRCRRRVYSTPAIPITFSMQKAGLNKCRLLGAAAIDAIATGAGTDEHIAQVKQIADYCLMLCDRLERDGSVSQPEELKSAREAAERAVEIVGELQAEFIARGPLACRTADRGDLMGLLDVNDALDSVATRRQARDVMVEMIAAIANTPGEPNVATDRRALEAQL